MIGANQPSQEGHAKKYSDQKKSKILIEIHTKENMLQVHLGNTAASVPDCLQ